MSEDSPNEAPKLRVRSRTVSEEDKINARPTEEQSSFEHTQAPETSEIDVQEPQKNLDADATLVLPQNKVNPELDPENTLVIPHENNELFQSPTLLDPSLSAPSEGKKSPLKLARPTVSASAENAPIPNIINEQKPLPNVQQAPQAEANYETQEKLLQKLEVVDGKMPAHIKYTALALGLVLIILPALMGLVSFVPAAILAFLFSLATAKLANQSFFVKGPGAIIGRCIYTAIFLLFSLFITSQVSTIYQDSVPVIEKKTELFLDKLENFDDIEDENAKSFYILLKGNEDLAAAKSLEFNEQASTNMEMVAKHFSSFGIQLFLLTAGFFLLGLSMCKFCFVGAPLALSGNNSTFSVLILSRSAKACLAYILSYLGLKFTGVESAGFIAAGLFVVTLISPFSILFFFLSTLTVYLCDGLSQTQLITSAILFVLLLLMEMNFKFFCKPLSSFKKFIPAEFFKSEVSELKDAILGMLQLATQALVIILVAGTAYLSYSVFEIKKMIDENEAVYSATEELFAKEGPQEEIKKTIDQGLYQREGDRRWLMLKIKYFMAKKQFPTTLDLAEAYKNGQSYPALNPDNRIVKFLKENFNEEFNDGEESRDDQAFALVLSNLDFVKKRTYLDFSEEYLGKNPDSLIAYLATARYYIAHRKPKRILTNLEAISSEMQRLDETAVETQVVQAFHLFYQKKYEAAKKAFDKVLEKDSLYRAEAKAWSKKAEETSRKAFFDDI